MFLLKSCLVEIPDHRRAQWRMYDLTHLLLFSVLAVASGATAYSSPIQFLADWISQHVDQPSKAACARPVGR